MLTPAKVREIVESGYRTIYGNTRDEESDAHRFAATSYALLEEKASILQGYLHGSFTDVVLADRLGNGLFINNAGPDTIFRLVLIEDDLLSHDDTIFIGSFSPDSHDRFPTTTFLPDPAEFADTSTVDRQVALVISAELEGVVYSDTLVQTIHLRKPVYALFSTTPSLGSRNEIYTDTGTAVVGFVSPVMPAPDQGKATASTSPNPTPSPSSPPIPAPHKCPDKA